MEYSKRCAGHFEDGKSNTEGSENAESGEAAGARSEAAGERAETNSAPTYGERRIAPVLEIGGVEKRRTQNARANAMGGSVSVAGIRPSA